ncbi:isoprenylcysteine carboxyl methyltransferase family protein [Brevibacillus thermoruber]|uniref:isoprenylcysteine carboxyl methyltransferase family protein n=1 Tax=Brevibacillus thermoruber TaxID=33942 RepID=UPI000405906D|nr:isoprenylcysteine carboxylmethyltransferase family protein [Brevibacillus thermoruber]
MGFFLAVYAAVVAQRLLELALARRNARHIRSAGGREVGAGHYKYIVALHVLFLVSLLAEGLLHEGRTAPWWAWTFSVFALAQGLRYWCIVSLGKRWNTRIYILPGAEPVRRGPYRFLRHPNYLVVATELIVLPLTFSAVATAVIFSLANFWLLWRVRIPAEERAVYDRP